MMDVRYCMVIVLILIKVLWRAMSLICKVVLSVSKKGMCVETHYNKDNADKMYSFKKKFI